MQVIKFRGRSIADGSIVYGGVLQYATASYIVQPDTRHADAALRCIEVHPDSVAQYINRRAVDGRENTNNKPTAPLPATRQRTSHTSDLA